MQTLFLVCIAIGGTLMVAQFALSLLGFGGHGLHFSGDVGTDFAHDFSADAAHDGSTGESHGGPSSTWYFGVITFQTVVAAMTFFGLAGMAASTADLAMPLPVVVATASGAGALLGVHALMRALQKLRSDGTQRMSDAVGCDGTVYLGIPAHHAGTGKVHFTLLNRLVEVDAVTSGEALPTGTKIVIVGVIGSDAVEVNPLPEPQPLAE